MRDEVLQQSIDRRAMFASPEQLANHLAKHIADELMSAIVERGFAYFILSPNDNMALMLRILSEIAIEWQYVKIFLADEYYVKDPLRRHESLIREHLLRAHARRAQFFPLYHESTNLEMASFLAASRLGRVRAKFDIVLLAMREEGYVAGFLPGAQRLSQALKVDSPALVLPMRSAKPFFPALLPCLTMTLGFLLNSKELLLYSEGNRQLAMIDEALLKAQSTDSPAIEDPLYALTCVFKAHYLASYLYWAPNERDLKQLEKEKESKIGLFAP